MHPVPFVIDSHTEKADVVFEPTCTDLLRRLWSTTISKCHHCHNKNRIDGFFFLHHTIRVPSSGLMMIIMASMKKCHKISMMVLASFTVSAFLGLEVIAFSNHHVGRISNRQLSGYNHLLPTSPYVTHNIHLYQSSTPYEDGQTTTPVNFPPPLTPLQRVTRAIEFYKNVLPVLAAYKTKELELEWGPKIFGQPKLSDSEQEEIWKDLDEWGSTRIAETIQELKGFYVKTGQVISTRVDLFPEAYTSKLRQLQDGLEPMPFELVKLVVEQELLNGAPLSELFATFDETPLGAASIAQVHKATLLDGRVVAIKLQRPNVEPKLRGDIANLKRISKALRNSLPVDYYPVFCELGDALENELDFLVEAQAMKKIHLAIRNGEGGSPVTIPLPVGELVTKRVLVMDFIPGVPLNRLADTMKEKGITPGSPESKLAGRRILDALAKAFGRMIFRAGVMHGDPHPGNIFIGQGGKVSLIDCGQFKSFSRSRRLQFAQIVLAVNEYQLAVGAASATGNSRGDDDVATRRAKKELADCARSFGITCVDGRESEDDLACSIALVLFGDTGIQLPGNYSSNELSSYSPIRLLTSFPQELVLLGRATVLLKGIAKSLGLPFSMVNQWYDDCQETLEFSARPSMPLWGTSSSDPMGDVSVASTTHEGTNNDKKIRLRQVGSLMKQWAKGKSVRLGTRVVQRLPTKVRSQLLEYVLARQEKEHSPKRVSTK